MWNRYWNKLNVYLDEIKCLFGLNVIWCNWMFLWNNWFYILYDLVEIVDFDGLRVNCCFDDEKILVCMIYGLNGMQMMKLRSYIWNNVWIVSFLCIVRIDSMFKHRSLSFIDYLSHLE